MDKLEPLQKFSDIDAEGYGHSCCLHPNGKYVLSSAAQARERVLVEALRNLLSGRDNAYAYEYARLLIEQYNDEQEGE